MKQTGVRRVAALALFAVLALGCDSNAPKADDWYTATGVPSTGSLASSAAMRGEFSLIQNAFSRLPALTGNNNEAVFVNAGGTALEPVDAATARDRLGLVLGTDVQAYDADLTAVAGLSGTGLIARTGAGTAATRSITTSGGGLSVTDGDGVSGNIELSLSGDTAALEALDSTGFPVRTGTSTWTQRSVAVSGDGLSITNGNGVSGNPTLSVANDLAAVEGITGTGCAARTGASTWTTRSMIGTSNEITVSNGNCVSGSPTFSLPSSLTFTEKTVTGGTFSDPTLSDPTLSGTVSGTYTLGGTPTFPSNVVLTDEEQTLTNKTLTAPVISSISNTGTLTLPTSTDTLVGRATTDTLTNKTLTAPTISGGTIDGATIGGATPDAGTFTTLSATGNVTLGDATSDTITTTGRFNAHLVPSTDNTYDLGSASLEWRNLYVDGTANIDALVADTADISGGTIDGATIGGSSAAAGTFTNLTASGSITHNKACATNFTRVSPGLCVRAPGGLVSLTRDACSTISYPDGATAVMLSAQATAVAANGAGASRYTYIRVFPNTGCTGSGSFQVAEADAWEFTALGGFQVLGKDLGSVVIPANSSYRIRLEDDAGDEGYGNYRIVAYWDN